MPAPTLRLAAAPDFPAIAALTNEFIRTTPTHFGYEEVTAAELQQLSRAHETRYPWLVAAADGAFAGYAKASGWRSRAAYDWTAETTIYLGAAHRGRGLGRLLYGRLIAVLKAQGFRSLIGGITLPNDASVALHEALGFAASGVVRDAGWKPGRWHDVGLRQLRLRADATPAAPLQPVATAFAATV